MIKKIIMIVGLVAAMSLSFAPVEVSAKVKAADESKCKKGGFLTFPAWHRNLKKDGNCAVMVGQGENDMKKALTIIAINIADIVLQLAMYAAIVFVVVGGFKYITAAGSPESMSSAKRTITNALIGMIVAMFSVVIVNIAAEAL